MKRILTAIWMCFAAPVTACDLSLLLAVDVSGSVDRNEFSIQMVGLADALRDGIVADSLVRQQAYLSLIQWTGSSRQRMTIPWVQMRSHADVSNFAEAVESDQRIWRNYSTAIGEALLAAHYAFSEIPNCTRRVIDVSGDGVSNEGSPPDLLREALRRDGIVINALAIETDQTDLTGYFFESVIAGEGAFVFTADGFEDYPEQIRRKLQREVLDRLSLVTED